jgi:hypothetical protein
MNLQRVTLKLAKEFYSQWGQEVFGSVGERPHRIYPSELVSAKLRIMMAVVRRAKRNGWYIWRQDNVLYIETPYGQCSWHMGQRDYVENPRWFRQFPLRLDLSWTKLHNSGLVVQAVLGSVAARRRIEKEKNYSIAEKMLHLHIYAPAIYQSIDLTVRQFSDGSVHIHPRDGFVDSAYPASVVVKQKIGKAQVVKFANSKMLQLATEDKVKPAVRYMEPQKSAHGYAVAEIKEAAEVLRQRMKSKL